MTDDRRKIIERYSGRPAAPVVEESTQEDADDYQAGSSVSGSRSAEIMLELRFKTSDAIAFSYALLLNAAWNPSEGITLEFTTHRVRLLGRNLRELYRALILHRLAHVQELQSRTDEQPDDATVVTTIEVTPA